MDHAEGVLGDLPRLDLAAVKAREHSVGRKLKETVDLAQVA